MVPAKASALAGAAVGGLTAQKGLTAQNRPDRLRTARNRGRPGTSDRGAVANNGPGRSFGLT